MTEDVEREISELPRGASPRSFQLFAQWLQDNRRALQDQIAGLAIRFEEVDRENKRRLEEIHKETRRTNGRVTDLEKNQALEVALDAGHSEWEKKVAQAEEQRQVRREKRWDRLANAGYVALGLLFGGLGQALVKAFGWF